MPLRDVPALTNALLSVIREPALAAGYGAAARAAVEDRFSMSGWLDRLSGVYGEVSHG